MGLSPRAHGVRSGAIPSVLIVCWEPLGSWAMISSPTLQTRLGLLLYIHSVTGDCSGGNIYRLAQCVSLQVQEQNFAFQIFDIHKYSKLLLFIQLRFMYFFGGWAEAASHASFVLLIARLLKRLLGRPYTPRRWPTGGSEKDFFCVFLS